MKPRSCWSVLAKKAKDEEETAQTAAARARNKVLELQQSRQRMDVLLQDYKERALVSQAQLQSMSQTTNSRQFLLQLQSLVNRVDEDLRVALRELEQAKTVLLGTSCSYDPDLPLVEENYLKGEPIPSLYTYAMTKRMLWVGAQSLGKQYGLKAIHLVPSTLCGNYYHEDGRQMHFIYDLARKILHAKRTGEPAVLWGDGHQRREVVSVVDFCQGMMQLIGKENTWGETFNLGAGQDYSIRDFAGALCQRVGIESSQIRYDETQYTGAKSKCLVVDKVRKWIPWEPAGLDSCVQLVLKAFN